ncbi:hypothetical protein GT348_00355 [Aristophania vespae]|uniref:Stringent starvation protein B n=1 Tax=Aristophania vespae TaxID=2697033 RepID=A0A6P1NEK3_9PROT|nr:ClpXP protease specificity-enhancing factor SspB [Aristophania vespae]QHI94980.1 hypothetical protein GT348_00355 [Aristophania vespae]UMM64147.1 hypothetical protein DM15PD_11380 [Aristophania vespae]
MTDDFNGPDDFDPTTPDSLIPYETWLENAHRNVMLDALEYVSRNGLAGEHHFYITFLTNLTGVDIPQRLKDRYPREMTIVLQHQFKNLNVDRQNKTMSVGLSFGGIPSTLTIPINAIIAFADPHVQFGLRFSAPTFSEDDNTEALPSTEDRDSVTMIHDLQPSSIEAKKTPISPEKRQEAEVVSLAAFRKRHPSTEDNTPNGNT